MPRPSKKVRKPNTFAGRTMFGPEIMLNEPLISGYLAAVSNAWATIEAVAADMMAYLISEPHLTYKNLKLDPLGKALYGQLPTFRQRWAVLNRIIDTRFTEEELRQFEKRRKALNKTLQDASDVRNMLVHSIWGQREGQDGILIRSTPYLLLEESAWEPETIDADQLRQHVLDLQDARKALEQFFSDTRNRKPMPPH